MKGLIIAIVDIDPAFWQGFAGAKQEVGFGKLFRVLEFFTGVIAAYQYRVHGIEEVAETEHLNELAAGFMFQKHDVLLLGCDVFYQKYG